MKLRKHVHNIQMKQTSGMIKGATEVDVELNKGDILHIGMTEVDQKNADGNNLTLVVVDIS